MRIFILSCLFVVWVVRAEDNMPEPMITLSIDAPISALAWSPDGQALAIATGEIGNFIDVGPIYVYRLQDQALTLITGDRIPATSLAWRASDNAIFSAYLAGYKTRFFYGWDSQTGNQIVQAPEGGDGLRLAFNPVDERLALTYGDTLMIYNAELTTPFDDSFYRTESGEWIDSRVVIWMLDGEHLITEGHPDAPEFISAWIPETGEITTLFEESDIFITQGGNLRVALSSDGEWLAVSIRWRSDAPLQRPENLFIWSTADGTLHHQLESTSDRIVSLAWSPDSRLLATASFGGMVTFWDIEHERIVAEWDASIYQLEWSSENLLAMAHSSGVMIFDMAEIEFE